MSTGGVYQCKRYQRFFVALPTYLQGSRGFTIVSVVLGILSVFTGIIGLEVRIEFDYPLKKRICLCQSSHLLNRHNLNMNEFH